MDKIKVVWREIENKKYCEDCPLKDSYPLLFKPTRNVEVMVITEGPNKEASKEVIASIANHPTYNFLYALFQGKFKPLNEEANVYWTHLRKCFLKIGEEPNRRDYTEDRYQAMRKCSKMYLMKEIKALKPKLIVAVGNKAKNFLSKYATELKKKLEEIVFKEGGIFNNIKIEEITTNLIIVPHPSGRNRLWVDLPKNAKDTLEKISQEIVKYL